MKTRIDISSVPTFWDLDRDEAEEQRDAAQQAHRHQLRGERVGRHDGLVSLPSSSKVRTQSNSKCLRAAQG